VTRTKVNLSEIEEDFTNIGISSSPKIAITKKKIKKEKKADDDGDQSD
jgi:hypothetical protein